MNAPLSRVEGLPVDVELPRGRRYLYRLTFDETRTSEDVAHDVRLRGGIVDAVMDLYGIMLVMTADVDGLSDVPGLTSVKYHPERDYW